MKWKDLLTALNGTDGSTPQDVFRVIQRWLADNIDLVSASPFDRFLLGRYANLDAALYPVDRSPLKGDEFLATREKLEKYPPRTADSMAQLLRDLVESLVVVSIDSPCPRCGNVARLLFSGSSSRQPVLECAQCGLAQDTQGNPYIGALDFATTEEVRHYQRLN
jgi:hypothetical protein